MAAIVSSIEAGEEAPNEYFNSLFNPLLDPDILAVLWNDARLAERDSNVDCLYYAVELAAALVDQRQIDQDHELAARLQKAERRRESKKRNKQRKKTTETSASAMHGCLYASLSTEQQTAFMAVRELLGTAYHRFGETGLVAALMDHNFDADATVEGLMFAEPPPQATRSLHESSSYASAASMTEPTEDSDPEPCALPAMRRSEVTAQQLQYLQPLLNHYLLHLRGRNPGILVRLDQDCLIYKGTQKAYSRTDNPTEVTIDIDLHGMTRKPAVDLLQSSLLYYHGLLGAGALTVAHDTRDGTVYSAAESRGSEAARGVVKCITVIYVVGQGLHSPGAIPVLRNTFARELSEYWGMFESGIDTSNAGQIYVRVKRIK